MEDGVRHDRGPSLPQRRGHRHGVDAGAMGVQDLAHVRPDGESLLRQAPLIGGDPWTGERGVVAGLSGAAGHLQGPDSLLGGNRGRGRAGRVVRVGTLAIAHLEPVLGIGDVRGARAV